MNPDLIQFQCSACQTVLTVPAHLAGVTGPCPICGHTVTSPSATSAGSFGATPAAPSPQPPAAAPSMPSAPAPLPPFPSQQALHGTTQHPGPSAPSSLSGSAGFGGNSGGLGGLNALGGLGAPLGVPAPSASSPSASTFPSAPALGAQPLQTPAWHQPGLGQTLLQPLPDATTQSSQAPASSQHSSPAFPSPTPSSGGFGSLPPRRPEGQPPLAGAPPSPAYPWPQSPANAPHQSLNQGPFPSLRTAGAPAPSGPISGTPLPASGSLTGQGTGKSLFGDQPAPASAAAPPTPERETPQKTTQPTKPAKSSRRSSLLPVLLVVALLAAAGWLAREPLSKLVQGAGPEAEEESQIQIPTLPDATAPASGQTAEGAAGSPASSGKNAEESPPSRAAEQLAATPPAPTKVEPSPTEPEAVKSAAPTPGDLASQNPNRASAAASAPATPAGGLMEVPSKPVTSATRSSTAESPSPITETDVRVDAPDEARPAAEALLKFLAAPNVTERLRYTLAADEMKPIMERYYAANPDGPVRVDSIGFVRLDEKPQMGGGAHAVFGVESKSWEYPVPVMLEEGKNGYRVDWLSFVEFKDRLLERFFKEYQEGPARFHVGITRTHYFEDEVPNAGNKDAFRVSTAPPNPFQKLVFVDKDSDLGKDLRDKIPWGSQVWAIAELEWLRLGSLQWVELAAVPQLNWYSVPTSAKSEQPAKAEQPTTSPPTETQRALPVGR